MGCGLWAALELWAAAASELLPPPPSKRILEALSQALSQLQPAALDNGGQADACWTQQPAVAQNGPSDLAVASVGFARDPKTSTPVLGGGREPLDCTFGLPIPPLAMFEGCFYQGALFILMVDKPPSSLAERIEAVLPSSGSYQMADSTCA